MNLKVNTGVVVLRQIRQGTHCTLHAMGNHQTCTLGDFFVEAERDHSKEFEKLTTLIDRIAEHGTPNNVQKCRFFTNEKLFELKTPGGLRVMAFWDENRIIVCSHGFLKKQQKTPRGELERAIVSRETYFEAKARNAVQIARDPL